VPTKFNPEDNSFSVQVNKLSKCDSLEDGKNFTHEEQLEINVEGDFVFKNKKQIMQYKIRKNTLFEEIKHLDIPKRIQLFPKNSHQ
jgi:hypothetical protein